MAFGASPNQPLTGGGAVTQPLPPLGPAFADAALGPAQRLYQAAAQPDNQQAFYDASLAPAQQLVSQLGPAPIAQGHAANPYLREMVEKNEEQAKLEQEHGRGATIATQAARGALDFVFSLGAVPAAILTESTGYLTGSKFLQDLGHGIGESATGSQAMATLFGSPVVEATKSIFGAANDPEKARLAYEQTIRNVHEQQEAWPMLSTVSHFAGATAASLGLGALAGASAIAPTFTQTLARGAALGGWEGLGAGGQAAYDEGRPFRDVVGSALMGGLLGAGTAAGFQGAAHYFEGAAFEEGLEKFALERTGKAIGVTGGDVRTLGQRKIMQMAKDVSEHVLDDGETVFPSSIFKAGTMPLDDVVERIGSARSELGSKIGTIRSTVGEFIDKSAPDLRPSVNVLESRIRKDVLNELESSSISGHKAGPILDVLKDLHGATAEGDTRISIGALRRIQERLNKEVYPPNPRGGLSAPVSAAREEQKIVSGILEDEVVKAVDRGAKQMGNVGHEGAALAAQYTKLKRLDSSFIHADQISRMAAARRLGNRGFSLTDTITGTAALAGDIASGGGVGAAIKGLGVTALHKYAREHGSAFMAALANKVARNSEKIGEVLAKTSDYFGEANIGVEAEAVTADAHAAAEAAAAGRRGLIAGTVGGNLLTMLWPKADHEVISVDAAGGREAQGVIAHLARAKARVNEAVERAGPNPDQRQVAQMLAMHRVSDELASKAGPFNAETWAEKPPNPMQKVLHRTEILNQVSTDLAQDAAHAASLKPSPDFELLFDRVKKLTKDADGPLAIGGVQSAVREMARGAPATPTGDQLRQVARLTLQRLSDADVPDAMTTGHELARRLSGLSDGASDPLTRDYIARQVTTLQQQLSDPSFGKAGAVYGQLTSAPSGGFQQLLDPATLRVALASTQSHGALPAALRELARSVLEAHDARKQLGGGSADAGVARQLKATEAKFLKAENAVTLDGGPAGRVLDFFKDAPGADARGLKGSPQMLVLNTMRPQMEKMLPILGKKSDRFSGGESRPSIPVPPKSPGELKTLYTDRMQALAQAVGSQDPTVGENAMRGMPNIPPAMQVAVMTDAQQRMATLLRDMPKPPANVRGKAFESLSSGDLRKANAMWEATTKPMSVFADFHAGTIDYDKARYTWKQYPGLQQAAQAGMLDVLHAHLDDNERAAIPDSMLTQIDYLLGFDGKLQTSVDRGFAQRMTAIAAAEAQSKPKPNGPLELATSKPTYTERLAGARKG